MNIRLVCVGRTDQGFVVEGLDEYSKRINRYLSFEILALPDIKNASSYSHIERSKRECDLLAQKLAPPDCRVLLDGAGRQRSSEELAKDMQAHMNRGIKTLDFVIGGPYGFTPEFRQSAQDLLSLSRMTFSHQLVRLVFSEQLYRALTILNHEPYHH